jgi:hypothetical protein
LYKQTELTELEEGLAKFDQEDNQDTAARWKVGHSIHVKGGRRNEIRSDLMLDIDQKLIEYGKMSAFLIPPVKQHPYNSCPGQLLLQDTQLPCLPKPPTHIFISFFDWVYSENPFGIGEQNYFHCQHNFIALQEPVTASLDQKLLQLITHGTGAFSVGPKQPSNSKPKISRNSSDPRHTRIELYLPVFD